MKAEIISIGDELLIGQTINTNAAFIAQKLTEIGVDVERITMVGDNENHILNALALAEKRSDVIIVTGGLGPTHDDITKKVFVQYFNARLKLDHQILKSIRQRFAKRKINMVKSNEEQALVPDNAIIIENKIGTAPGMLFKKGNRLFFVLPGVPAEMKAMTEEYIIPLIKSKSSQIIKQRTLHTSGIPESTLFEKLGDMKKLEQLAKIAFLPHGGRVDIRLTVKGEDEQACQKKLEQAEQLIRERVGSKIWGVDSESFEEIVSNELIKQGKTLAIVEYGTRGEITVRFSRNLQTEKFLIGGFVLGSAQASMTILGVPENLLTQEGLVSETGAKILAHYGQKKTGADIAISIVHDSQQEITTHFVLKEGEHTITRQFIYPFDPDVSIQRIGTATLHLLFQYLSRQKFA